MLYRFREAQAAELGLGTRADRRPKVASACKSLRECERWRGEILREISRKVSKIQDGASPFRFVAFCGLTDSLFVVFCVCVALVVLHSIVTNSRSLGLRSTGRER
jgi:hypothetical protein